MQKNYRGRQKAEREKLATTCQILRGELARKKKEVAHALERQAAVKTELHNLVQTAEEAMLMTALMDRPAFDQPEKSSLPIPDARVVSTQCRSGRSGTMRWQ